MKSKQGYKNQKSDSPSIGKWLKKYFYKNKLNRNVSKNNLVVHSDFMDWEGFISEEMDLH